MKYSKLFSLAVLTALISAGSVNAASVTANIKANQTSAKSSNVYLNKGTKTNISGTNNTNAYNRDLYLNHFKAQTGPDLSQFSVRIGSGKSYSLNSEIYVNGDHYVELDPFGVLTSGTVGKGTLKTR